MSRFQEMKWILMNWRGRFLKNGEDLFECISMKWGALLKEQIEAYSFPYNNVPYWVTQNGYNIAN
jgi:hypothetical protein